MLDTQKLSFSIRDYQILKEINLSIKPGELLMIVGPNGAGKSTLLNLLANENKASEGSIVFKRKSLLKWDQAALSQNKAKFSQMNSSDIPLSVMDIVMMGRYPYFNSTPTANDIHLAEQMMQETDVFKYKDRNYNTLSGGEKQRVHLARVMAQLQNEILHKVAFFDEPLNNLDVKHQYRILETIQAFTNRGNAAVVVLHDLNLAAQFADYILLMKEGNMVVHGRPEMVYTTEYMQNAYDFPCAIYPHPITGNPLVIFGESDTKTRANPSPNDYFQLLL